MNSKGGLLGRPVKLVYYDDQSNPSMVPGIYTKLLDVDNVDMVIGGYGTNSLAPAIPLMMQRKKVFIGLLGLAANSESNYANYFSINPAGSDPKPAFTRDFFEVAMAQKPAPQTVAIVAADQEFSRNASDGARANAQKAGLKIVYDKTYPPATTDFTPVVRAIQATSPDIVVICSFPLDSVGMVRAVNETGFKPKMVGGAMVGLQATAIKMQLGPILNGFVNFDFWLPVPTMNYPGVADFMKTYQTKAPGEGVDPLGYYTAPSAYAQLQVLQHSVEATKSFDDSKLADYIRTHTFKTVVGDITFGAKGEWAQSRILRVQFQDIKGKDLNQFRDMATHVVLSRPAHKSCEAIYPYERAKN